MNYEELLAIYSELIGPFTAVDADGKTLSDRYRDIDRRPISDEEKETAKRDLSDTYFSKYPGFDFSKYDAERQRVKADYVRTTESEEEFSRDKNNFMTQLDYEIVHMKANEVKNALRNEISTIEKAISNRVSALNARKEEINRAGLVISARAEIINIDNELANLTRLQSMIDTDKNTLYLQAAPYTDYKYAFMTTPGANVERLNRYFKDGTLTMFSTFKDYDEKIYKCKHDIRNNEDEIDVLRRLMREPATNVSIGIDVEHNRAIVADYSRQIDELIARNEEIQFELNFYELTRKMNADHNKVSHEYEPFKKHHEAGNAFDDSTITAKKAEEAILAIVLDPLNVDKFDHDTVERLYELNIHKGDKGFKGSALEFEFETIKKKLIEDAKSLGLVSSDLSSALDDAIDKNRDRKAELDNSTITRNSNVPDYGRFVTVTFVDGTMNGLYGLKPDNTLTLHRGGDILLNYDPNKKTDMFPEKDGFDFIGWTYIDIDGVEKPFDFQMRRVEVDISLLSADQKNRRNELIAKQQTGFLNRDEEKELNDLSFRSVYVSPMINYNITVKANFRERTKTITDLDKCKVSFNTNGGKCPFFDYSPIFVIKGTTLPPIPEPILDDSHEFAGWTVDGEPFDPSKPIVEDTELKAVFRDKSLGDDHDGTPEDEDKEKTDDEDKIKVTYVDKDNNIINVIEIAKGDAVPADSIPAAPTVEDMDFKAWVDETGEPVPFDKKFDKDTVLKATYEPSKFITIKFVGEDDTVYETVKIERGSKYTKLPPERDENGKRIKGIKYDKHGNKKQKHTTRLYGWLNEDGEKVDFDEMTFDHSTTLKANCKFDWERVASVGVGAITSVIALNASPMLAAGLVGGGIAVMAASAPVAVTSFVLKQLVDKGVINKKQPITSISKPSDKLKKFFVDAYNKTIANYYNYDNIFHASLTGTLVGAITSAIGSINPDPTWNDFSYETQYTASTTTHDIDVTKITNGDPVIRSGVTNPVKVIYDKECWRDGCVTGYYDDAHNFIKVKTLEELGNNELVVNKYDGSGKLITEMGKFKNEWVSKYTVANTLPGVVDTQATIDNAIQSAFNANPSASVDIIASKVAEKTGEVVTSEMVTNVIGTSLKM